MMLKCHLALPADRQLWLGWPTAEKGSPPADQRFWREYPKAGGNSRGQSHRLAENVRLRGRLLRANALAREGAAKRFATNLEGK
jgi:hypothetical protein